MCWSPNKTWLLTSDLRGVIKYHDVFLTNVEQFQGHREAIRELRCADWWWWWGGGQVLTASRLTNFARAPRSPRSWAPMSTKFVTACDDTTLGLWDFATKTCERTLTGTCGTRTLAHTAMPSHNSLGALGDTTNTTQVTWAMFEL